VGRQRSRTRRRLPGVEGLSVTVSVGAAAVRETPLTLADQCLNAAERSGRSRVIGAL
jgi:hypothetical protein